MSEHFALLALELLAEADELHAVDAIADDTVSAVHALLEGTGDVVTRYRRARVEIAAGLDERYQLAAAYPSMTEFWADAVAQEDGRVASTFWDSYEHGLRRRLERVLATTFGSGEAVLVNSGMSAIDVALRSVGLRPGSVVLAHERAYFETEVYLDEVLAPTGVRVVRTDLTCPVRIAEALALRPSAVLVESVLNGPTCDIPVIESLLESGVPVILDNSVVSHGLPGALLTGRSPVLVVESGSKYLCRQASSGVIYGWDELGRTARLVARKVGQQLQGRALHRMRVGEIIHCGHRVMGQAARAEEFAATLRAELPAALVSTAATGAAGRRDVLAELVHAGRGGCLLFVSLRHSDVDGDELHQEVIAEWAVATGQPVRAGFGWTTTAGRSYGRDALNTSAGRSFIRMSIGLEPPERQRELALTFAKVAEHRMGV